MRRRIFIYHTVTVLAVLVALLAVSGVVMHWISGRYQEGGRAAMDDQAERVQAELIGYAPSSADWNALDARLAEWGYDLHVSRGGGEVYSSLDPFRTEVYRSFSASTVWPSESPLTILDDGIMSIGIQKGGIPWWPCRGRTSPSFRPPAAPG